MPIRADLRHLYRTQEWKAAQRAVLVRAQGRCEWCRKPDRKAVWKASGLLGLTTIPTFFIARFCILFGDA